MSASSPARVRSQRCAGGSGLRSLGGVDSEDGAIVCICWCGALCAPPEPSRSPRLASPPLTLVAAAPLTAQPQASGHGAGGETKDTQRDARGTTQTAFAGRGASRSVALHDRLRPRCLGLHYLGGYGGSAGCSSATLLVRRHTCDFAEPSQRTCEGTFHRYRAQCYLTTSRFT